MIDPYRLRLAAAPAAAVLDAARGARPGRPLHRTSRSVKGVLA